MKSKKHFHFAFLLILSFRNWLINYCSIHTPYFWLSIQFKWNKKIINKRDINHDLFLRPTYGSTDPHTQDNIYRAIVEDSVKITHIDSLIKTEDCEELLTYSLPLVHGLLNPRCDSSGAPQSVSPRYRSLILRSHRVVYQISDQASGAADPARGSKSGQFNLD